MSANIKKWPTNDEVYAEVCRQRIVFGTYVSPNAVNDVMAALRSLARPAVVSEGQAAAGLRIVARDGGPTVELDYTPEQFDKLMEIAVRDPSAMLYTRPAAPAPEAPTEQKERT